MPEIKVEIQKKRICKLQIDISQKLTGDFQLNLKNRVQIKTPKTGDEMTSFLSMDTNIGIPDSDDFTIAIRTEFIFKFNRVPHDYESIMEERCIPLAQESLFKSIDNILVEMGYDKLNLSEKQSN